MPASKTRIKHTRTVCTSSLNNPRRRITNNKTRRRRKRANERRRWATDATKTKACPSMATEPAPGYKNSKHPHATCCLLLLPLRLFSAATVVHQKRRIRQRQGSADKQPSEMFADQQPPARPPTFFAQTKNPNPPPRHPALFP